MAVLYLGACYDREASYRESEWQAVSSDREPATEGVVGSFPLSVTVPVPTSMVSPHQIVLSLPKQICFYFSEEERVEGLETFIPIPFLQSYVTLKREATVCPTGLLCGKVSSLNVVWKNVKFIRKL